MRTLLVLAVVATAANTGSAIKCYICNSHTNETCKDLPSSSADSYLQECGDLIDGEKYTLCRKLEMSLDMDFGKFHPAEKRIHRACGYEDAADSHKYKERQRNEKGGAADTSCYYKSGYNTRTWVCSCYDDGCNAAHLPSALLLPFAAAVVVVFLRGAY